MSFTDDPKQLHPHEPHAETAGDQDHTAMMSFAAAGVAMYLRTQVGSPVPDAPRVTAV